MGQERHLLNPGETGITLCRENFAVGKNAGTYTKLEGNGEERTERKVWVWSAFWEKKIKGGSN